MKGLLVSAFVVATAAFTPVSAQNELLHIDMSVTDRISGRHHLLDALRRLKLEDRLRDRIRFNLGFHDGAVCTTPPPVGIADIDPHRSLFVHDAETLGAGDFSLRRTLQQIADQVSASAPGTTPETIFRQFWDTQNDTANAVIASNVHCDDNGGKINGFPLNKCPRPEGIEAVGTDAAITSRIDTDYQPIALVNRIDLAHSGWRNCGEHRIIYATESGIAKNLVIFEAVLPNPKPGCRSGCRDVIDFWLDMSDDPDAASRATKLEQFFYTKLPGFNPVVHVNHYSASGASSTYGGSGSGQIRTNQFLTRAGMGTGPWTLKEFKTLLSCASGSCDFDIVPISVKGNPYGLLWNREIATGAAAPSTPITNIATLATGLQSSVEAQVTLDGLANPDINSFSYSVDLDKNAAESQSQNPSIDHYPGQFAAGADATFRTALGNAAAPFGLTGDQIVKRATALSCAGCHKPESFGLTAPNAIGPGMSWPEALNFIHVETSLEPMLFTVAEAAVFNNNRSGFELSPALNNVFLPARKNHLVGIANEEVCDCVPNRLVIRMPPLLERHFPELMRQSQIKLRHAIEEREQEFRMKRKVTPLELKEHFRQTKQLISETEKVREKALLSRGAALPKVSLDPVPVNLQIDRARLTDKRLRQVKASAVKEIADSEPPRKTVTGSFRVH